MGLESAQAWRLGGARLSAAVGFCCARRPKGSSREPGPSARLARGRAKRVSGREKRPRRPEASRARERRAPLPGAGRALRLPGPARSLPPPSPVLHARPPPSIPGWMTEAFQTWAEPEQASSEAAAISR